MQEKEDKQHLRHEEVEVLEAEGTQEFAFFRIN